MTALTPQDVPASIKNTLVVKKSVRKMTEIKHSSLENEMSGPAIARGVESGQTRDLSLTLPTSSTHMIFPSQL